VTGTNDHGPFLIAGILNTPLLYTEGEGAAASFARSDAF
jgi:hypothetical protein